MAREFVNKSPKEIELIVDECLKRVGINKVTNNQVALLTRLIFSGIANYFFNRPDDLIKMGYIEFRKNPDKEQLLAVNIIKNEEVGVVNASTLWRYYKGELTSEAELKGIIDEFVHDLISYAQTQEQNIMSISNRTTVELSKKRRRKNGIQT